MSHWCSHDVIVAWSVKLSCTTSGTFTRRPLEDSGIDLNTYSYSKEHSPAFSLLLLRPLKHFGYGATTHQIFKQSMIIKNEVL
jgi:hypothetical protein